MLYANWLIANGNATWVTQNLWPALKLDLDYVQNNWNRSTYVPDCSLHYTFTDVTYPSFDLWEEVNSSSFFTTAVQHRALREGAALAQKLGQTDVISGYNDQATNLLCFQQVRIWHNLHRLSSLTDRSDIQKHCRWLLHCQHWWWSLRD